MSRVAETGETKDLREVFSPSYPCENLSMTGKNLNLKSAKKRMQSNFAKMSNMRVIQKRLVYVIGLSTSLAFKDAQLGKFEYFGQYGKIVKLVVNKNKVYNMNGPNGPSYSAYITYSTPEECALAILALDNALIDGHLLRASYGTTKYCANFLKSTECHNKDCLYLHSYADENEIVDRDDMNTNKSIFVSQHFLAMNVAQIFNPEKHSKLIAMKANKTFFPSPHTIYEKDIVIEQRKKLGCTFGDINCKKREKSRFDFASRAALNEPVEVPDFISKLIQKNISMFLKMKKFTPLLDTYCFVNNSSTSKDDERINYFTFCDKNLLREYNENNHWARFVISHNNNETFKIALEKLAKEEEMKFLLKFKSA